MRNGESGRCPLCYDVGLPEDAGWTLECGGYGPRPAAYRGSWYPLMGSVLGPYGMGCGRFEVAEGCHWCALDAMANSSPSIHCLAGAADDGCGCLPLRCSCCMRDKSRGGIGGGGGFAGIRRRFEREGVCSGMVHLLLLLLVKA